jgi:hypothetical protein
MLIKTSITAEAARAGAVDPDVVVALLQDDFSVKDDEIVGDVGKAVGKLLDSRPYLRSANPMRGVGSVDGGRHTGQRQQQQETPSQKMDDVLRSSR